MNRAYAILVSAFPMPKISMHQIERSHLALFDRVGRSLTLVAAWRKQLLTLYSLSFYNQGQANSSNVAGQVDDNPSSNV